MNEVANPTTVLNFFKRREGHHSGKKLRMISKFEISYSTASVSDHDTMGNTTSEAGSRAGEASVKSVSEILVEELKKDEVCNLPYYCCIM